MLVNRNLSYSKRAAVMSAFGREFAKTGAVPPEFHRWFLDAFEARNIGDYDIHRHISAEQAKEHLRRAPVIVKAAEEYLQGQSGRS